MASDSSIYGWQDESGKFMDFPQSLWKIRANDRIGDGQRHPPQCYFSAQPWTIKLYIEHVDRLSIRALLWSDDFYSRTNKRLSYLSRLQFHIFQAFKASISYLSRLLPRLFLFANYLEIVLIRATVITGQRAQFLGSGLKGANHLCIQAGKFPSCLFTFKGLSPSCEFSMKVLSKIL